MILPLVLLFGIRRRAEQRKDDVGVNVHLATLPGLLGFLCGSWVQVDGGCITGADVAAKPCSASLLCEFSSFLVLCIGQLALGSWGHCGCLLFGGF